MLNHNTNVNTVPTTPHTTIQRGEYERKEKERCVRQKRKKEMKQQDERRGQEIGKRKT